MRNPALLLSLFLITASAQGAVTKLVIVPPSSVTLAGSSNVNKWRCVGKTLSGTFELPAERTAIVAEAESMERNGGSGMIDKELSRRSRFELQIPIGTLSCGNPIMDSDLRRTLRTEQFPKIGFRFDELLGALSYDAESQTWCAQIAGRITLAGAARSSVIVLRGTRSGTRIRLRATFPARMTEFGLKPPTALFGAIKANDALAVSFDLLLEMR